MVAGRQQVSLHEEQVSILGRQPSVREADSTCQRVSRFRGALYPAGWRMATAAGRWIAGSRCECLTKLCSTKVDTKTLNAASYESDSNS